MRIICFYSTSSVFSLLLLVSSIEGGRIRRFLYSACLLLRREKFKWEGGVGSPSQGGFEKGGRNLCDTEKEREN